MQLSWAMEPPSGRMHPAGEVLAEYAGGEMDAARRRELAAHLNGCARCRREVEELRALPGLLAALPSIPAPRSFALDEVTLRRAEGERRGAVWPAWTSLAASIVLALGAVGSLLGAGGGGGAPSLPASMSRIANQESVGSAPAGGTDAERGSPGAAPEGAFQTAPGATAVGADAPASQVAPSGAPSGATAAPAPETTADDLDATAESRATASAEGATSAADASDSPPAATEERAGGEEQPRTAAAPAQVEERQQTVTAARTFARSGRVPTAAPNEPRWTTPGPTSAAAAPGSTAVSRPSPGAIETVGRATPAVASVAEDAPADLSARAETATAVVAVAIRSDAPSGDATEASGGGAQLAGVLGLLSALCAGVAALLFRHHAPG